MMNQQPPFPMQPMAEQMAQQGRFGDSMLVHMNPIEVAGIASLSPTGQLTTNPMTGQPEAFLPFLAPLLGSFLGSTALTGLGAGGILGATGLSSAAAGAIGSGLATTAVTGDLKEGLLSGLTGFGIGKALGAAKDIATGADKLVAGIDATAKTGVELGADAAQKAAAADALVKSGADAATISAADLTAATAQDAAAQNALQLASQEQALGAARQAQGLGDISSLKDLGNVGKNLLTPGAAIPIAIGEGERAAMARQEKMDRMFGEDQARSEEELRRAEEALDSARFLNVTGEGYGAYDYLGDDPYFPTNLSQGGITSINPADFMRRQTELHGLAGEMPPVKRMREGGPSFNPSPSYGLGGSTRAQAALRGSVVIKPEELEGYRPGFDPEIKYFREPTQEEIDAAKPPASTPTPTPTPDTSPGSAIMSAKADPDRDFSEEQSLYQKAKATVESGGGSVRKRKAAKATVERFEKEFGVPGAQESVEEFYYKDTTPPPASFGVAAPAVSTPAATSPTPSGIESILQANLESGNIPPETRALIMESALGRGGMGRGIGMQGGGETNKALEDAQKLLEQTRMALLGRLDEEESEIIINRFIDEFGLETFQQLRSVVLEDVVPDSQKEGLIEGVGSGMDDLVPGMIGDQQPVAVSPGEFIVPADVVSGLGDGDTNAGAKDLEGMMDRVRMERTGTTQQPAPLMAKRGGILPA
tara:strand:- start:6197 stop:8314 length:2118 start_codon:yes stop_codon:yes gene_type:complete